MTTVTIDKNRLKTLIGTLGPDVGDVRMQARDMGLEAEVAMTTHYVRVRTSATVDESGEIVVSDLKKFNDFLKTLSTTANTITLNQPKDKPLRISCGKTSLTIPTSEYIKSAISLPRARQAIQDAEDNNWKAWVGTPLTHSGRVKCVDLEPAAKMHKVVGKGRPFYTQFEKDEFTIHAGVKGATQMFVSMDVENGDGDQSVVSQFGPWLPDLIDTLPGGHVDIYTGDSTVLILDHAEKEHLLMIIDQQEEI